MRYASGLSSAGMFLEIVAVLVCVLSVFPVLADAQGGQGQDAVYNSSNIIVGSSSFIDASMFGAQNTDICTVIHNLLVNNVPMTGAVIDARGLPGTTHTRMTCTTSPWAGIANPPPSTILLPAGTIVIPSKWVLPNNTHLIGEGDALNPPPATPIPSGTILQANFSSGDMIDLGSSSVCPLVGGVATAILIASLRAQEASGASASATEQTANNDAQAPTKNWPGGNPLKIAQLKWYQANQTTSFNVGKTQNSNPYGIAFDGANIWTANSGEGTVSKLRASDGAMLGSFTVGGTPNFVVFDGANVWVTVSPNTVSKLRASDGKILGSFTVRGAPWWPAFDGENIWVPNTHDGTVSKLRASDGKTLGTFAVGEAIGAAFDGENVWVTGYSTGKVTKLRAKDGKVVGTYGVGHNPIGVAFDGTNIWVANNSDDSVTKLRASDGKNLGTFLTGGAYGVAFDGAHLWVTTEPGISALLPSLYTFPAFH